MGIAFGINYGLRYYIYSLTGNTASYMLSSSSIWLGVCLGLFLPIFSNIWPIQRALGKNLRTSLDLYQRSVNEFVIQVKELGAVGLSVN